MTQNDKLHFVLSLPLSLSLSLSLSHLQRLLESLVPKESESSNSSIIINRQPLRERRGDRVEDLPDPDGDHGHHGEGGEGADEGDEPGGFHCQEASYEEGLVADLRQKDEGERLVEPGLLELRYVLGVQDLSSRGEGGRGAGEEEEGGEGDGEEEGEEGGRRSGSGRRSGRS